MISVWGLVSVRALQSEDKLWSERIRRDLLNNNDKNTLHLPHYIKRLSVEGIYRLGYGCTSLPSGLEGDLLAGLLSTSSPTPSLEFVWVLSRARPQLYEPHTPLFTTKEMNTVIMHVNMKNLFSFTLEGNIFFSSLRLYHNYTGWNT